MSHDRRARYERAKSEDHLQLMEGSWLFYQGARVRWMIGEWRSFTISHQVRIVFVVKINVYNRSI